MFSWLEGQKLQYRFVYKRSFTKLLNSNTKMQFTLELTFLSFFFISACSSESYGANCSQKCLCLNGGMCDPKDGHCSCKAGWTGSFCQQGTAFLHL